MSLPEFTCLCPRTGQPDFATLELEYVPDRLCVELKSLKLYIWSFRDRGAYHEAVTNEILATLVSALEPRYHAPGGALQRSRGHHHHRGGRAPLPPLGTHVARHPALGIRRQAPPAGADSDPASHTVHRYAHRYNRALEN